MVSKAACHYKRHLRRNVIQYTYIVRFASSYSHTHIHTRLSNRVPDTAAFPIPIMSVTSHRVLHTLITPFCQFRTLFSHIQLLRPGEHPHTAIQMTLITMSMPLLKPPSYL